jgi:hypothetical protein
MAQTGFTPIQLYYSSTTTNVPLAANLAYGELAINITDGKLFYKDNANAVQVIGWKVVPATAGGTGQTSYAVGDLLYADTTTSLAKLPDVATGNALISGGVSTAPSWGKIGLTTHVSGVLPVANGGTNASVASITAFNNITGYTASGATGTTSTNLVFSTSPTLVTPTLGASLATSIKFGSGTVLADYEEGTWTPNVGGTATYYAQVGKYTRIGNIVRISGVVVINVLGTGSATTIFGLPIVANPPGPTDFIGFSNFSGLALTVTYIAGSAGGSQIDIRSLLVAGTGVASNNVLGNGTRVDFAGTYTA